LSSTRLCGFHPPDPPYTRYRGRNGRTATNGDNARWPKPAFRWMHRVLKQGGFRVSFYGWNRSTFSAMLGAMPVFLIIGHSGLPQARRFVSTLSPLRARAGLPACQGRRHATEQADPDVIDLPNTGNRLHSAAIFSASS